MAGRSPGAVAIEAGTAGTPDPPPELGAGAEPVLAAADCWAGEGKKVAFFPLCTCHWSQSKTMEKPKITHKMVRRISFMKISFRKMKCRQSGKTALAFLRAQDHDRHCTKVDNGQFGTKQGSYHTRSHEFAMPQAHRQSMSAQICNSNQAKGSKRACRLSLSLSGLTASWPNARLQLAKQKL